MDEYKIVLDSSGELKYNFIHQTEYLIIRDACKDFLSKYPSYPVKKFKVTPVIWWCWFQGEENAPDICQSCLKSVKKYYPDFELFIVTDENVNELIKFPNYILEKYKSGIISRAHFSDIVRIFLLYEYGGIWMDSTIYSTRREDYLYEYPFFVFKHIYRGLDAIAASSWLISSAPKHPIIRMIRDLLCSYWRSNDELNYYYLIHTFMTFAADHYYKLWNDIPDFSNVPSHLLQNEITRVFDKKRYDQIIAMTGIHKLTYKLLEDIKDEKTFYNYIIKNT